MKQIGFAVQYTSGKNEGKFWKWGFPGWVAGSTPHVFEREEEAIGAVEAPEKDSKKVVKVYIED